MPKFTNLSFFLMNVKAGGCTKYGKGALRQRAVPGRMRFKSVQGIPENSVPGVHHRIAQMS
jgi:hypothetical protein